MTALPPATQRFIDAAAAAGLGVEVRQFPEGTKTAADAAAAIGCEVGAIVKSLVFMADDEPLVLFVPGDFRVDVRKVAAVTGVARVRRATLDEVRAHTGFAAGGTPPLGHDSRLRVIADPGLRRYPEVWAAAGTPTTVFPVSPERLLGSAGASEHDITEHR